MPTSNKLSKDRSPIPRRVGSIVALLVVFVLVDVLLCLVLEPYGGQTEVVWSEYRKAQSIDTAIIGASTAGYGMDPRVIDQKLGSASFNTGTPGQSMDNTLATLEQVIRDHQLKRVILCFGYDTMADTPYVNASAIYTQAKCVGESPTEALADIGRLVSCDYFFTKMYSLSCAFPWAFDHVDYTPQAISANIQNRLRGDVIAASEAYAESIGDDWRYDGQGFGGIRNERSPAATHLESYARFTDRDFYEGNIQSLREICDLCNEQGLPLYVVIPPYRPSTVREYGYDYVKNMAPLRTIVEDAGAHYFELNMVTRSFFDPNLSCFCDNVHLSASWAPLASAAVASLIQQVEAGQDVSDLFYDYTARGWRQYLESLDFVDSVDYTYAVNDEGDAVVEATTVTGSKTPVNYQFELYDSDTGEWCVAQEFSSDKTFLLKHDQGPHASIRITAHATNGRQDMDRTVEGSVDF